MEDDQPTPRPAGAADSPRRIWMRVRYGSRVLQDRSIWQTYSTVLTTMDRLFRKGLLGPYWQGKASVIGCAAALKIWSAECSERTPATPSYPDGALHLSYFVEAVGQLDEKLLMSCKRWSNSSVPS